MQYRLEPIQKKHDRKSFDCGNQELNNYLATTARSADERNISKTFVACDIESPNTILGYVTLTGCSITSPPDHKLYRNYPHPLQAIKLARMAVDQRYQGHDLGSQLIIHAVQTTIETADRVGVIGLVVDPKNTDLVNYYGQFGFTKVDPGSESLEMWLPLQDCIAALNDPGLMSMAST